MPTIFVAEGFRFVIHTKDHRPPHVHAMKDGGDAMIDFVSITLLQVAGLGKADAAAALRIVCDHQQELMDAWRRLYG